MKRSVLVVSLFALAVPAMALNNRSAVSVNGLDSNPCTPASPCRSFTAAIAQTNASGEIIALDSAGYGPFTISNSMTVGGAPGVHAALTVTGSVGITIAAGSSDSVTIRNLTLIGAGGNDGINGTAGQIRVLDCAISGFNSDAAIYVNSTVLTVARCDLFDDYFGVRIESQNSVGAALVSDSLIEHCGSGVQVLGTVFTASGTVVNSRISASSNSAISAIALAGSNSYVVVDGSTINRGTYAVDAETIGGNNNTTVYLANNEIAFFGTAINTVGTAVVKSYGDNRFSQVTTVGPLAPVSKQ